MTTVCKMENFSDPVSGLYLPNKSVGVAPMLCINRWLKEYEAKKQVRTVRTKIFKCIRIVFGAAKKKNKTKNNNQRKEKILLVRIRYGEPHNCKAFETAIGLRDDLTRL